MKTTPHFEAKIAGRPEIRLEWCERVVADPIEVREQGNGWCQMWGYIEEAGKYLRVITLEDRATLHNAFFDRAYGRKR